MTKHEALVISAYTGCLLCKWDELHCFIEKKLGRPVLTHELASPDVLETLRKKLKPELLEICKEAN